MKEKTLTLFCLLLTLITFAQESEKNEPVERKHEIKIDGLKLLAGPIFEGTYEFVKNPNSGYGVSLLINLEGDSDYEEDLSVTPFYRMYFFNKEDYGAKGFFVEGFGKLTTGKEKIYTVDIVEKNNYTDFSLGMSLGKKWVNSNGFVFEALIGVSRTLGSGEHEAYIRGGLFVGYRF